jgi:outer membrane protein, heavy metal efflux system
MRMRSIGPARTLFWVGLVATLAASVPAEASSSVAITLDEALSRASTHPDLRIAEADVRVAEGDLTSAGTIPHNPEVSAAVSPRSGAPGGARDYDASLEQTIELGAKRSSRIKAATARRDAARSRLDWVRAQVMARVRRTYYLGVAANERVATARDAEAVANELRSAARDRLDLGAGTQLEVNVASAAAGRARGERLAAERAYRLARTELAAALGAKGPEDLEPTGRLDVLAAPTLDEEALVARALAQRPDLRAVQQESLAAEADVRLAGALGNPDITLGASYERSADDNRFLVGLSIPIPLFNRNQGGRAVASALRSRATVSEEAVRESVQREVRGAYRALVLAREAVEGFDREVVGGLGDNVSLARESFQAGKISLFDFNLLRRDLVETQLAYLDALAELIEARYALEIATGAGLE